jgi:2-polyprenyl-3-methyl-5-hydroxy-6-metoxy-1,4-benzoquinol methylase
MEGQTDFNKMASQWDKNPVPVRIAQGVVEAIFRENILTSDMDVLDYGCGTGLVTLRLQPVVRTITGVDSSEGMLGILRDKVRLAGVTNVRTHLVNFGKGGRVQGTYHLLVSNMTLHHVKDPQALLRHWHELVVPGGQLCFADLDTEDGTFHTDNTGVFHFGFDRGTLKTLIASAGFQNIRDTTATSVEREIEGNGKREFSVFLMTARK